MNYILTSKGSLPSAKILRNSLVSLSGRRIFVTSKPDKIKEKDIILVRYGNSFPVIGEDISTNTPEQIKICSNKKTFSTLLGNNFWTPKFYDVPELDKLSFPLVIRESLALSHGKGIHVVEDENNFNLIWKAGMYFTEYIFLDFELRVHILKGEIVKIFKKELKNNDDKFPIRNNDSCNFKLKNKDNFPKLDVVVEELYKNFPISFVALDIGWSKKNQNYFVLEANSAPGLNELTANLYASSIMEDLNVYWAGKNN